MVSPPIDLTRYAAWLRSHNSSARTVHDRLWFAKRILGEWPDLSSCTEENVRAHLGNADYSKATRATYFTHARSLFTWLVATGQLAQDPTDHMARPPSSKPSPRPLSPAEAALALAKAPQRTHDILLLGMYAGFRAHEAAKMHSRDVTETHLQVVGKGGRAAVLPTHPAIWAAAQRHDGYWFPNGDTHLTALTVSLAVSRVFWAAGLEGSFHRCRHYYGTSLLRAGVNIRVVQELMRHTSLATTAAYLGVDEDEKHAAIMALAA